MHNQQFFRWYYLLAILLVTIGLSSCGLKMRQAIVLPYNTIFIGGAITQELRINLNRYLSAGTNARMVITPKDADLLIMLNETNGKQILSYNNLGQVTAYRLITQITFYVNNKEGDELIPSADLFLTRDMDFSVSAPTAAEALEVLLVSDMRQDIVSQIVRRLATLQSKKPVVKPVQ